MIRDPINCVRYLNLKRQSENPWKHFFFPFCVCVFDFVQEKFLRTVKRSPNEVQNFQKKKKKNVAKKLQNFQTKMTNHRIAQQSQTASLLLRRKAMISSLVPYMFFPNQWTIKLTKFYPNSAARFVWIVRFPADSFKECSFSNCAFLF